MYRREWQTPKFLHTRVTGQQTRLYTPTMTSADVSPDVIEHALRDLVDGPASLLLPKLAAGEVLSIDERLTVARHIGVQSIRGPWMRAQYDASAEFLNLRTFRGYLEYTAKRSAQDPAYDGPKLEQAELVSMLAAIDSGEVGLDFTKDHWLSFVVEALLDPEIPAIIASLPWVVVTTHSGVFVTSDNPVVKARVFDRFPGQPRAGWLSPSIETTYALDPKRLLVMRAGLKEGLGTASKSWREDVNRRCVEYANEEFYSVNEQPGLHLRFAQAAPVRVHTGTIDDGKREPVLHVAEPYVEGRPFS